MYILSLSHHPSIWSWQALILMSNSFMSITAMECKVISEKPLQRQLQTPTVLPYLWLNPPLVDLVTGLSWWVLWIIKESRVFDYGVLIILLSFKEMVFFFISSSNRSSDPVPRRRCFTILSNNVGVTCQNKVLC